MGLTEIVVYDFKYCVISVFQADKHHSLLVKILSEELKVSPEQILDFELCLADYQDGVSDC